MQSVVSVVLCVRNGAAVVDRQLAALAAQDFDGPWELVVVDNGSSDATRDVVAPWIEGRPTWRLVSEPEPGVNRARNRGVTTTHAPLVVLCDADDAVEPAWLGAMVAGLGDADVVGGALVDDPDARPRSPWRNEFQRDGLPVVHGHPYAMGASLGFRRELFDLVGGFDPRYERGADDVDFVVRAAGAGARVAFVPGARTRYRVKEDWRSLLRQQFGYGRGYQRLLELHRLPGDPRTRHQRTRALAHSAVGLLRHAGRVGDPEQRYAYLASVAHVGGEGVELAVQTLGAAANSVRNVQES
ncbi:MAG: glycosyltransferase [Acidimicrobiia bacterium]